MTDDSFHVRHHNDNNNSNSLTPAGVWRHNRCSSSDRFWVVSDLTVLST